MFRVRLLRREVAQVEELGGKCIGHFCAHQGVILLLRRRVDRIQPLRSHDQFGVLQDSGTRAGDILLRVDIGRIGLGIGEGALVHLVGIDSYWRITVAKPRVVAQTQINALELGIVGIPESDRASKLRQHVGVEDAVFILHLSKQERVGHRGDGLAHDQRGVDTKRIYPHIDRIRVLNDGAAGREGVILTTAEESGQNEYYNDEFIPHYSTMNCKNPHNSPIRPRCKAESVCRWSARS